MLLQILFCSFNTIYSRPLLASPCNFNQPCISKDKSVANFQGQQKRLLSQKGHVGHRSKRKLNLARTVRRYPKWGLCSKKCWKTLKVKIGHEKNRKKRKNAEKGTRKRWKEGGQNLNKISVKRRRRAKWCQKNKCWSRDNKRDKIRRESKGRKEWEKKNVNKNQRKRERKKGQRRRANNCIQRQQNKWSPGNKKKIRKRCFKGGCVKRKLDKSKSSKKTGWKRRGCVGRGKRSCKRKANPDCRKINAFVQRKPSKNQDSIDPMSYLEK